MTGQRDTSETIQFLRDDRASGSRRWQGLCQMRVRLARNLPAVYPSAFAAMVATPMSERVYDIDKVERGMVGYADDPNDSNKFGHVFTFVGKTESGLRLVDTNDALITGGGSVVRYNWFEPNWGDKFQFAATSCNGFDLLLPGQTEPPVTHPLPQREPKAENFDYARHRLEKALVWHEKHGYSALARKIRRQLRDLEDLKRRSIRRRQKRRDAER